MVFEPDMGTYSVGSMMITPASQSGRVGGTMQIDVAGDAAARLAQQQATHVIMVAFHRAHLLVHGGASGGSTPPTITSPISPAAWQPTTEITRLNPMLPLWRIVAYEPCRPRSGAL